jgi:hypothetical protein
MIESPDHFACTMTTRMMRIARVMRIGERYDIDEEDRG